MSEWINVKNKLPESLPNRWSAPVIAMSDKGEIFKLSCNGTYWQRTKAFVESDSLEVTHWMPLNEPED